MIPFRNAELFQTGGAGRIRSIEVFFGFIPGAAKLLAGVSGGGSGRSGYKGFLAIYLVYGA